ncbi:L-serine dehydratase/L-threonine deaminase [Geodia barretti]|uniref:L-serine ammonia-lyase n=1 Tax=Geodia barretti TaxID=519541 RepID=A0AA35W2S2_GEOBA|nr:L-serine dehydratase/L-threonine deaminase [Geodia barretti]
MATSVPSPAKARQLYVRTPLLCSRKLSKRVGANVWLKMESVQPSGSFKIRGLSNFANKAVERGCTRFASSSGGNAGLAAAYIARQLGLPITVVVPETTPSFIADKLREEGAEVEVVGKVRGFLSCDCRRNWCQEIRMPGSETVLYGRSCLPEGGRVNS